MKNQNCKFKVAICDDFGNVKEYLRCKSVEDIHITCDKLSEEGKLYKGYVGGALYVKHINL